MNLVGGLGKLSHYFAIQFSFLVDELLQHADRFVLLHRKPAEVELAH